MLTPDEARSTWCPMARIARRETPEPAENYMPGSGLELVAGCNTDALGGVRVPKSCTCIAAGCAMWRWQPRQGLKRTIKQDGPPGRENYPVDEIGPLPPTHGYCGLAGSPLTT